MIFRLKWYKAPSWWIKYH